MFERFTDRARKTMALANREALSLNHTYIRTEHILLGMVKEGSGVGANVLKNLGVDLRRVRSEVEKVLEKGPTTVAMGKLPQTPSAKRVIEYAIGASRDLNHNYVGTEHLLLGLLREQDGVAAQVLMNLGLELEGVRNEVLDLLGSAALPELFPTRYEASDQAAAPDVAARYLLGLRAILRSRCERAAQSGDHQLAEAYRKLLDETHGLLSQLATILGCELYDEEP